MICSVSQRLGGKAGWRLRDGKCLRGRRRSSSDRTGAVGFEIESIMESRGESASCCKRYLLIPVGAPRPVCYLRESVPHAPRLGGQVRQSLCLPLPLQAKGAGANRTRWWFSRAPQQTESIATSLLCALSLLLRSVQNGWKMMLGRVSLGVPSAPSAHHRPGTTCEATARPRDI